MVSYSNFAQPKERITTPKMAPQAGETLKDFLISYLSPDDQVVVKTILHTILNKDRMTCNRLADIVHGATHGKIKFQLIL